MSRPISQLYYSLGYHFQDAKLVTLALTHRSKGNKNNERLEFLGDSILNFVIAEDLFIRFPKAKEGELSRLRSQIVKGATLAEVAKEHDISAYLNMGAGELKSGGYLRDSILADAVEALIGAIYLESGFEKAKECIQHWFASRLQKLSLAKPHKDAKSTLQEWLQARGFDLPLYKVINTEGAPHEQIFEVQCELPELALVSKGAGTSRRIAEQNAASEALSMLKQKK